MSISFFNIDLECTLVEYAICKVPMFAFTKSQLLTSATFALEKTANFGSTIIAFELNVHFANVKMNIEFIIDFGSEISAFQ